MGQEAADENDDCEDSEGERDDHAALHVSVAAAANGVVRFDSDDARPPGNRFSDELLAEDEALRCASFADANGFAVCAAQPVQLDAT